MTDHSPSLAEVERWLIARIAGYLEISPAQVDPRDSFTSYGLESRTAVELCGDLEDWLGREFEPTLTWDYPSIEQLAQYLIEAG